MKKLFLPLAIAFGLFLVWIIYLANTGGASFFFELVRSTPYGDKIGHFFLFGILTLLVNLATGMKMLTLWRISVPVGSAVILLVVGLEELSQGFIPSRTLDIKDFIFDVLGISVFSLIGLYIHRRWGIHVVPATGKE